MADRVPITYTFGNHMHWVDMQWLWGYHVLPGSVRDMLHFCRETGAKGNVNFDGIGYEKLACEDPEAFAELRAAVQAGTIEVVGASYGQPYGLFHGGESNVRQRVYGARTVRRLFGKWPKTFWEEEFDFFPQLPQILCGCGFQDASLYFQWTWHTPEIPREDVPVVWWEGCDGSRLKTATRNRLNLHQWPEDVQILMDELAETGGEADSLILQWLELMPSPDWMCRSEVLLPKTKELLGDDRFQVSFATLGEYLDTYKPEPPVRRYTMDEVWHGMSLGKNADRHPRSSHAIERSIRSKEALNCMLGRFGRPYSSWDVYPAWEIEEAWRSLLIAQHHDNHECEGLCGHVGEVYMGQAHRLASTWQEEAHLYSRIATEKRQRVFANPLGWCRRQYYRNNKGVLHVVEVSPFGHKLGKPKPVQSKGWQEQGKKYCYSRGSFEIEIDRSTWSVTMKAGPLRRTTPLPNVSWRSGKVEFGPFVKVKKVHCHENQLTFFFKSGKESLIVDIVVSPCLDAIELEYMTWSCLLDPGMNSGFKVSWPLKGKIIADKPYEVCHAEPKGEWPRKYPTGDWMTSPQWFESVRNPFTSQSFVDVVEEDGSGWMILHNASQQWFLTNEGVTCLAMMKDPWDESNCVMYGRVQFALHLHGPLSDSQRFKLGQETFGGGIGGNICDSPGMSHTNELFNDHSKELISDLPTSFSFASNTPENVVMTALYRETRDRGYGTDNYAANDFEADYPYIIRLVEFDGIESQVELKINGTVAAAAKTNLLGQHELTLEPELGAGEFGPQSTLRFTMRPKEIATVYFDLVEGRKQTRDLDAKREIWATVHRTETTT